MDFTYFFSDSYTQLLVALLLLGLIFTALYYGLFYMRVGRAQRILPPAKPDEMLPPVSVVMTAHNDGEWLRENLIYLLEQDYPDFEVVVVDYISHDDTKFVLQLLSENYSRLKIVPFREDINLFQGKKYPLSIGIKSAKNDILLLADPDCMPHDLENFSWIREVVRGYDNPQTSIVLGYCGLKPKAGFFGALQQYDNIIYSVSYLGAALMHRPYTGSGRNLSYRRKFFFDHGAFIQHYGIADGADDMFVNQNSTPENTAVVLQDNSFVEAEPKETLAAFRDMRRHRIATRRYYSFKLKMLMQIRPLSLILFYGSLIALLVLGLFPWQILLGVLVLKLAWQIIAFSQVSRRFGHKKLYWFSPLLELYFLFANTFISLLPLPKQKRR